VAHLLSYNLIRNVQARAAREHAGRRSAEFTVAKQQLEKKQNLLTFTKGKPGKWCEKFVASDLSTDGWQPAGSHRARAR